VPSPPPNTSKHTSRSHSAQHHTSKPLRCSALTLVLQEIAHARLSPRQPVSLAVNAALTLPQCAHPARKHELRDILCDLGLCLWPEGGEPLGEADLALPRDEEKPVDLRPDDQSARCSACWTGASSVARRLTPMLRLVAAQRRCEDEAGRRAWSGGASRRRRGAWCWAVRGRRRRVGAARPRRAALRPSTAHVRAPRDLLLARSREKWSHELQSAP
jgi:hypothetical protein